MGRANHTITWRDQHGFTLIELLVAVLILLIGIIATIGVFGTSKRTTLVAQRHEMAVHIAQREMEAMRSLKYSELGLMYNHNDANAPHQSSDPKHPNNRVASDGDFIVNPSGSPSTCCEEMVTLDHGASNGKVDPGEESGVAGDPFTVGQGSSAVSGRIFRYVSWRDENCAALLCDGTRNTKRLAIAVTLNPNGSPPLGPFKPVWETSIASDPNEGPTASNDPPPPPPPPPSTSAQNFYLYDQRCSDNEASNVYSAPTGHHATWDTGSDVAVCENVDTAKRPHLMGAVAPTYANPPVPPFKYTNDVGPPDNWPAGLATVRPGSDTGSGCPSASYPTADATNTTKPNKWSVHAWVTKKFTSAFQLSGRVYLSAWTTSVGSQAAAGSFCATLVARSNAGGTAVDTLLGSMSPDYTPWPSTKIEPGVSCGAADFPCGRQLSFSTTIGATSVPANSRLVLVLSLLSDSGKDIVWLLDDPRYRTLVEVETSTPCGPSGPCSAS